MLVSNFTSSVYSCMVEIVCMLLKNFRASFDHEIHDQYLGLMMQLASITINIIGTIVTAVIDAN